MFAAVPVAAQTVLQIGDSLVFFLDFAPAVFVAFITGIAIIITARVAVLTLVAGAAVRGGECVVDDCGFPAAGAVAE